MCEHHSDGYREVPNHPRATEAPDVSLGDLSVASRRGFIFLSLAALTGCGVSGGEQALTTPLPPPVWPDGQVPRTKPPVQLPPKAVVAKPAPKVEVPQTLGVMPRASWSKRAPDYSGMDRMLPIKYITVHHDGLDPFWKTAERDCAARIEFIRNSHTAGRHFADIGYHFVVDRTGRVWEGRPLNYQGAHVKNCNEGNIGVLCMGNFDVQAPSDQQFGSLCRHVNRLMNQYKVSGRNVKTHQEWAKTACPGRNLQGRFKKVRDKGMIA
jgi:hypothetical protein